MIASTLSSRCLHRGLLATNCRHLFVTSNATSKVLRCSYAANTNNANYATTATATKATSNQGGEGGSIAGKIFFTSLCIGTFGLGSWQTKRYFEKVEMTQKRENDLKMDPLSGLDAWRDTTSSSDQARNIKTGNTDAASAKSYRRVNLRGKFQHDRGILVGPRGPPPGALAESGPNSGRGGGGGMSSSAQGYWVITPFVVEDNSGGGGGDGDVGDGSAIRTTEEGSEVVENSKAKRGWFGRFWGKTSPELSSESESCSSNSDTEHGPSPSSSSATSKEQTIVWINRGWIPRNYISKNNEITTPWLRPKGTVQLTAMESQTETPKTFSPPSRLDSKDYRRKGNDCERNETVNKLLWLDRNAMEEMMNSSSTTAPSSSLHPPLFVEIKSEDDGGKKVQGGGPPRFPVKPTEEYVGEFKVTPAIHAGYALTWFGLSGAGMVMTRTLLRRGR